jgi:hypothetical protein
MWLSFRYELKKRLWFQLKMFRNFRALSVLTNLFNCLYIRVHLTADRILEKNVINFFSVTYPLKYFYIFIPYFDKQTQALYGKKKKKKKTLGNTVLIPRLRMPETIPPLLCVVLIVAVTKLHASRSQQNRTTLQHVQLSPGEWRQLGTRILAKLAML